MKSAIVLLVQIVPLFLGGCQISINNMNNPLISEYETPFHVPPFHQIKSKHFIQALNDAIYEHELEIDSIVNNDQQPSFENTIKALDRSGSKLRNVQSIFSGIKSAHTTDDIQEIAGDFSKKVSEHFDDIYMNHDPFKKVEAVNTDKDRMNLSVEQLSLVEYYFKRFIRNGVNLSEEKKLELREINQRLAELSVLFDQNLLAETNNFKLILDKKDQLAGLPEDIVSTAAATANQMKLNGKWVFTVHKPSMIPFLQYSEYPDLRKIIYDAYCNRGNNDNEYDNKAIIAEMTNLRVRKAH